MTGVLIFGATGQLGKALVRQSPQAHAPSRADIDLSSPEDCADAILEYRPKAIINAAAYTAVDRAEEDEATAHLINATAPGVMARTAATLGIPFVHVSTDYVFDGSGQSPWTPEDQPNPLGAYGRTKRAGEIAVLQAGGCPVILRTSWVFSADGINFVHAILRLSAERDQLSIVADQIGGPTPASALATACLTIANTLRAAPEKAGIYHYSGSPDVSWAEYARAIVARTQRQTHIEDIMTTQYPTPAKRPLNSRLSCNSTTTTFGLNRPDWRKILDDVVPEMEAQR
ncbi:dTDP-4-dehydrorhamnose reductase [Ruegeria meonggei]|uniref:dTDP-4-dehydrorhamnose reductase n=1 Tax=Ruegeria meonggei TaxID=1446476 RepID=A0A1X7ACK3_9RHOB|nr:dTDP-4-dehydrorhamnose reductase [Ruegeria meonggei]SLN75849.1 dTDP-4-dehydrorhamnose reductase [Ruegeria meonggei]